jgi:hypothetical protein
MGGSTQVEAVKSMVYETVGHTLLAEQSYRREPFISCYERTTTTLDLVHNRLRVISELTWPESDPGQAQSKSIMVAGPEGCVHTAAGGSNLSGPDSPCSPAEIDWVEETFGLGAPRLFDTALQASDLHFMPSVMLRSTPHTAIAFTWRGIAAQILLNLFNHLPDAVETIQQLHDHWYQWGDVRRRVDFDNWVTVEGVRYPTNLVEERNGILWKSTQLLNLKFGVALDPAAFEMDLRLRGGGTIERMGTVLRSEAGRRTCSRCHIFSRRLEDHVGRTRGWCHGPRDSDFGNLHGGSFC